MSVSPHLPPRAPAVQPEPVPAAALLPPTLANDPPAQLALLLSSALNENEALKRDLAHYKRRAERAEHRLSEIQKASRSSQSSSSPGQFDEDAARVAILECQARADQAEAARDDLHARLLRLQEAWIEFDSYIGSFEQKQADARAKFASLLVPRPGHLLVLADAPPPLRQQALAKDHTFPNSRIRPRAGSFDGSGYPPDFPGAPPAKRLRAEQPIPDRLPPPRERYRSPSPHRPHRHFNGHLNPSPLPPSGATAAHSSSPSHHVHPLHARGRPDRPRDIITNSPQLNPAADPPVAGPRRHRRRSASRSRSRASSASLDEMIIEATTGDDPDRSDEVEATASQQIRSQVMNPIRLPTTHLSPHNNISRSHRRSTSADPDREYYVSPPHHGRSNPSAPASLHPSASAVAAGSSSLPTGPGVPGAGPSQSSKPGQLQTYQTHIFAPPVTGAPIKKSKLTNTPSNASMVNGSAPAAGVAPSSSIGGGGFPPTNPQGQRICRQCGLAGRYKDGKCVEKWGPGPEGPGTVCDRCRKKMKRVERRGTLDSQQMNASHHGNNNGRSLHGTHSSQSSMHRSDTVIIDQRSLPMSKSVGSLPQNTLSRPDIDDTRSRAISPRAAPSVRHSSQRSPPTPPTIATLPGSSVEEELSLESNRSGRHRASRGQSIDPVVPQRDHSNRSSPSLTPPTPGSSHNAPSQGIDGGHSSSKAKSSPSDADADADADAEAEIDGDAEVDADAEAELLEAVDAAEANNAATDEEWLKKEEP
ncbi:hypothetical protein K474DRAFT_1404576 [Panus rudis PR-1116 ss-1]|nr:hypothetical protein K474DRAFT_1404576 [Panus rudis PR-1116 ss-1]